MRVKTTVQRRIEMPRLDGTPSVS